MDIRKEGRWVVGQVDRVDSSRSIIPDEFQANIIGIEYKNLPWEWGWERNIRPEDHCLASQGLPSDEKHWNSDPEGQISLSNPHTNNGLFFSCSSLNTAFSC